jgi:hypothetical protein
LTSSCNTTLFPLGVRGGGVEGGRGWV